MGVKIVPTVGRVVHFHPGKNDTLFTGNKQPLNAHVCHVHGDDMVNLCVMDANGGTHSRTSVRLVQDGEPKPDFSYCEWMEYQRGQAAKTQQLEAVTDAARKGFQSR